MIIRPLEMEDINQADLPTLDLPHLGIEPEHYDAIEKAVKELSRQGLEIKLIKA
jgi:sulfate adenylyltransferase subunit 1